MFLVPRGEPALHEGLPRQFLGDIATFGEPGGNRIEGEHPKHKIAHPGGLLGRNGRGDLVEGGFPHIADTARGNHQIDILELLPGTPGQRMLLEIDRNTGIEKADGHRIVERLFGLIEPENGDPGTMIKVFEELPVVLHDLGRRGIRKAWLAPVVVELFHRQIVLEKRGVHPV